MPWPGCAAKADKLVGDTEGCMQYMKETGGEKGTGIVL